MTSGSIQVQTMPGSSYLLGRWEERQTHAVRTGSTGLTAHMHRAGQGRGKNWPPSQGTREAVALSSCPAQPGHWYPARLTPEPWSRSCLSTCDEPWLGAPPASSCGLALWGKPLPFASSPSSNFLPSTEGSLPGS